MNTLILSKFDPFKFVKTKPGAEFFFERVQLIIEEKTGPCRMFFNLYVTTPKWINQKIQDWNKLNLENTLVIEKYDERIIKQHIDEILQSCDSPTAQVAWGKLNFYLENNETSEDDEEEIVWDD